MPKWLLPIAIPLASVVVVLAGVIVLGTMARERLAALDRYALPFAIIDCDPPAGLARPDFLGEVQYLAGWPDRVRLLDPQLPQQLATAFARHPWVERVERVEVGRDRVMIRLLYRTPVLAVPWAPTGADGPLRAVDGKGVLLPIAAVLAGLPLYAGDVVAPAGAPGEAWGDPRIAAAAQTAAFLKPHTDRLPIEKIEVEDSGDVWLVRDGRRVRWGRPPGSEQPGEQPAEVRLRQLLGEV